NENFASAAVKLSHFLLNSSLDDLSRTRGLAITARGQQIVAGLLFFFAAFVGASQANGQAITADINVKLQPVLEHIDLVTDINLVRNSLFVCTQPGRLYRKSLSANSAPEVFLDVRAEVGRLGSHIPSLPGLGYPIPETY